MIDLHCHLLPGIDDGAQSPEDSVAMAKLAVAAGTTTIACTPHIYPGLFENTNETIAAAHKVLTAALEQAGVQLNIVLGADIQIVPDLVSKLRSGVLPTLNGTRYFLFEPPHHVPAPAMLDLVHSSVAAGYVPLITHPERLAYAGERYNEFKEAVARGGWLQITAGALTGNFGPGPQKLAERMLADGLVYLVASDGHNTKRRQPVLADGFARCVELVGEAEAERLCIERPAAILANENPTEVTPPSPERKKAGGRGIFARLFG